MTAQNLNITNNKKGFTLIELLVVIGILAILLAITLIAINPARQFANANNTKRRSDVAQILSAIGQYTAQNQGQLPADITALAVNTPTEFNSTNFPTMCAQLVTDYAPALPKDPTLNAADVTAADCAAAPGTPWDTSYRIAKDATNRITVSADNAELGVVISVTR